MELGKLVSKTTKVDILVTPIVTILSGVAIAKLACPVIAYLMYMLGSFVNTATEMQPFVMGIIVSVVVGMVLTLPISSAALCAMIGITGLAGGAATAGCCAQMVGFAVISFRENRWSGLVARRGLASMLRWATSAGVPQFGSHRRLPRRSAAPSQRCSSNWNAPALRPVWGPADWSARSVSSAPCRRAAP